MKYFQVCIISTNFSYFSCEFLRLDLFLFPEAETVLDILGSLELSESIGKLEAAELLGGPFNASSKLIAW